MAYVHLGNVATVEAAQKLIASAMHNELNELASYRDTGSHDWATERIARLEQLLPEVQKLGADVASVDVDAIRFGWHVYHDNR